MPDTLGEIKKRNKNKKYAGYISSRVLFLLQVLMQRLFIAGAAALWKV